MARSVPSNRSVSALNRSQSENNLISALPVPVTFLDMSPEEAEQVLEKGEHRVDRDAMVSTTGPGDSEEEQRFPSVKSGAMEPLVAIPVAIESDKVAFGTGTPARPILSSTVAAMGSIATASQPPSTSHPSSSGRVNVTVRMRPPLSSETEFDLACCRGPDNAVEIKSCEPERLYYYDHVFDGSVSQQTVYRTVAASLVEDVVSGVNGCVIAYGQTGAGKTYTLSELSLEHLGIIPRAMQDLFARVDQLTEDYDVTVNLQYFQIYMELIQDLLQPEKMNLPVREKGGRGIFIEGLSQHRVRSVQDVMSLLQLGERSKMVATTKMNQASSRAHTVLHVTVERRERSTGQQYQSAQTQTQTQNIFLNRVLRGKLTCVDLAGSERAARTGAEGIQLEETKSINLSLSALGNVIAALSQEKPSFIPWRDSKLTRILQDTLGGNAKCSLIINVGPDNSNHHETLTSLLFGQRAMKVAVKAIINEELDYKLVAADLQSKLDALADATRSEITHLSQTRDRLMSKTEQLTVELSRSKQENSELSQKGQELEKKMTELIRENAALQASCREHERKWNDFEQVVTEHDSPVKSVMAAGNTSLHSNSSSGHIIMLLDRLVEKLHVPESKHGPLPTHDTFLQYLLQDVERLIACLHLLEEEHFIVLPSVEVYGSHTQLLATSFALSALMDRSVDREHSLHHCQWLLSSLTGQGDFASLFTAALLPSHAQNLQLQSRMVTALGGIPTPAVPGLHGKEPHIMGVREEELLLQAVMQVSEEEGGGGGDISTIAGEVRDNLQSQELVSLKARLKDATGRVEVLVQEQAGYVKDLTQSSTVMEVLQQQLQTANTAQLSLQTQVQQLQQDNSYMENEVNRLRRLILGKLKGSSDESPTVGETVPDELPKKSKSKPSSSSSSSSSSLALSATAAAKVSMEPPANPVEFIKYLKTRLHDWKESEPVFDFATEEEVAIRKDDRPPSDDNDANTNTDIDHHHTDDNPTQPRSDSVEERTASPLNSPSHYGSEEPSWQEGTVEEQYVDHQVSTGIKALHLDDLSSSGISSRPTQESAEHDMTSHSVLKGLEASAARLRERALGLSKMQN